jgi:hypothetical protein
MNRFQEKLNYSLTKRKENRFYMKMHQKIIALKQKQISKRTEIISPNILIIIE